MFSDRRFQTQLGFWNEYANKVAEAERQVLDPDLAANIVWRLSVCPAAVESIFSRARIEFYSADEKGALLYDHV